ncbi:aminotransferase class IV family protein [Arcobacter vandammei]|uniref:aminotransferase class IV family protein n=1 Tax=Arcobacter vandammei TaxID=2782243 RepID=UPI0018E03384|nr:aminotransferase class IV family protein [Arcobacter vandammei]
MYFETIKCEDFEIFNLDYHNKRVAKTIGKNLNLQEYITPISPELLRCKIIYDKDEILDVQYFPYTKRDTRSFKIVFDDNIDYSKKYLNREKIDELLLKKELCDEIIILKNGIVTDTSIANIAIFYENRWITSEFPLLNGTTRARLLDEKKIFEKNITLEMLLNSKKLAIFNAMIGFCELNDYSFSL